MGLRCVRGSTHWNVFVPVTVHLWSSGLVLANDLPAGAVIEANDLHAGEIDLAANDSAPILNAADAVGRQLLRPGKAGSSLHPTQLKPRRFFAAGDSVKLVVQGPGFQVNGRALAITPGDEGQCVRIRTDSGRILCGRPGAGRQVEISL
jgi:flagella basal body P-ring formation protein FlgA